METPKLSLRAAEKEDVSFIFNSWLKSYRDSPPVRGVPNNLYYQHQHSTIEKIIHRDTCRLVLAVAIDDPNQIYGYIVFEDLPEKNLVHWVYVKHPLRTFGIGSLLFNIANKTDRTEYTHNSKCAPTYAKKHNLIFNPYAA